MILFMNQTNKSVLIPIDALGLYQRLIITLARGFCYHYENMPIQIY